MPRRHAHTQWRTLGTHSHNTHTYGTKCMIFFLYTDFFFFFSLLFSFIRLFPSSAPSHRRHRRRRCRNSVRLLVERRSLTERVVINRRANVPLRRKSIGKKIIVHFRQGYDRPQSQSRQRWHDEPKKKKSFSMFISSISCSGCTPFISWREKLKKSSRRHLHTVYCCWLLRYDAINSRTHRIRRAIGYFGFWCRRINYFICNL